jgi:hypothetical protein
MLSCAIARACAAPERTSARASETVHLMIGCQRGGCLTSGAPRLTPHTHHTAHTPHTPHTPHMSRRRGAVQELLNTELALKGLPSLDWREIMHVLRKGVGDDSEPVLLGTRRTRTCAT